MNKIPLPLVNMEVSRFCLDNTVSILFFQEDNYLTLRIDNEFRFMHAGETITLQPGNLPSLMPIFVLFEATVQEAYADESGKLTVRFKSGDILEVDANEQYEAWEIYGMGGSTEKLMIVCTPGGELSIWNK
jgi:hypothetical protein